MPYTEGDPTIYLSTDNSKHFYHSLPLGKGMSCPDADDRNGNIYVICTDGEKLFLSVVTKQDILEGPSPDAVLLKELK